MVRGCGNTSETYDVLGCYVQTNYPNYFNNFWEYMFVIFIIIIILMYIYKYIKRYKLKNGKRI